MYTISQIGDMFSISRSTLLYYDSIGLLRAAQRSPAGYRLYSDEDKSQLEKIRQLRDLGIPLQRVSQYLAAKAEGGTAILVQRIFAINEQIGTLREQQRQVLALLEAQGTLRGAMKNPNAQTHLAAQLGITPENYRQVHWIFEKAAPESHRRFLGFLGFSDLQIRELIKSLKKRA